MADEKPVSLAEAARLLGVTSDAVRQRIRRGSLLATRDNYGRLQVFLPDLETVREGDEAAGRTDRTRTDMAVSHAYGQPNDANALRELVATLREQLEKAEASAERERERLEADLAREREGRERAEQEARAERDRLLEEARAEREAERRERAALLEQVRAATDRLAALQVEQEGDRERHASELAALRAEIEALRRPWWRRMLGGRR
jgi:hypothetical protein